MPKRKEGAGSSKGWTTYSLRGPKLTKTPEPPLKKKRIRNRPKDLWRQPYDLTPELARRLLSGLAENHRNRLRVMAKNGGRASVKQLLAVTGDSDLRVLSYFQGALSRKLRRLVGDRDKRIHLIGWDYTSTRWNADHTMIVNGTCYVTETSAGVLREAFGIKPKKNSQ
jgi:hypothetical protein